MLHALRCDLGNTQNCWEANTYARPMTELIWHDSLCSMFIQMHDVDHKMNKRTPAKAQQLTALGHAKRNKA